MTDNPTIEQAHSSLTIYSIRSIGQYS